MALVFQHIYKRSPYWKISKLVFENLKKSLKKINMTAKLEKSEGEAELQIIHSLLSVLY